MAYIRPVYDRKSRGQPSSGKPIGYEVRYRDADGIQRTKGGFRRKRDAEAYAVEVESSRQQGTLIPHRRASTRFHEVATAWLASIQSRRKPKTVEGYQRLLSVHVLPTFGNRRVGSITYGDADRFVRSSRDSAASPAPSETPSSCSRWSSTMRSGTVISESIRALMSTFRPPNRLRCCSSPVRKCAPSPRQ